jgi:23S rRNA (uracil1939-C5)-methyltransferase
MTRVTMAETAPVSDARAARLRAGQRVPVTIERLVFQGDGLGRLPDGRVIFVPATAPGDEVEVQVEEDRGHFVRGTAVGCRLASPLRVEPPCRYFAYER